MVLTQDPIVIAALSAVAIVVVHWWAHRRFGDEDAFSEAGVGRTGGAIALATFLLVYGLLSMDTVLGGDFLTAEVLAAGLVTFFLGMLFMNKGRMWFVNLLAQKEPLLLAAGVMIFLLFNNTAAMAVGLFLFGLGLVSRFSTRIGV